ncbi:MULTISPECIES: acyltransferase [Streptomyces]|uniref:Acyltransferase n=1 Tax=Streptomyces lycii TaxID=2654337 RepID=A0ABQ7FGE2_9ACTN|nr:MULTISPECIES: acyltransferase [Streptomyces]KAF4407657.1 acyltransferase [Streptomyces lycii]PGH48550.1 acyltransferase [Streptomyces sp. Ru87]
MSAEHTTVRERTAPYRPAAPGGHGPAGSAPGPESALPGAGLEGGAPPDHAKRRAPSGRLRALDGLRLVAALMVAVYHYGGRDGDIGTAWGTSPAEQFPTASQYFSYGNLGVQIFFVISGFVICMSGWGRPLRSFFASRVSRLFPAYWVAVALVTLVFALPWVAFDAVSPSHALVNMTMLQMPLGAERVLGVCWTLWVELRFYALFALCVVLPGASRQRVVLFCAVWTLASAVAEASGEPLLDVVLMPEYSAYFIGGIGLYLLHRDRRDAVAWGIVIVSWLIGQHYAVDRLWHPPNPDFFSYRSSVGIILVVTAGFVAVGLIALGYLRWANWRWLTVAGALTYPFYLVHEHLGWVSVQFLHRTLGLPSAVTFAGTIAAMLLLAWLLYRCVETPLTPWIRRMLTAGNRR